MRTAICLLSLAGCSEYDFSSEDRPIEGPPPPITEPVPPETTEATTVETHTGSRPMTLPCDDSYSENMPWLRTDVWTDAQAPSDTAGLPWYEVDFDDTLWMDLEGLPDEDWSTTDHDLFYRATFWLDSVGDTEIEFVGNDGVWLYANGSFVGHWGGDWREGGCINEPVNCGENSFAPPVDVTDFLVEGNNVLAVMLTNGPTGYYLEINATCVEE